MSDNWGPDGHDPSQDDADGQPTDGSAPQTGAPGDAGLGAADGQPPSSPPPPPPPPATPPTTPPVEPLTPIAGATDADSTVTLADQSTGSTRSGAGSKVVAGIAGVLLIGGGAAFALSNASDDGAGNAEDAVDQLLDAASDEDILGALGALDPAERASLAAPVEDLFDELERLEIVDDSFELDGVAGFDLEFENVTYRVEPIRDGLSRVYLTGGTATIGVDTDEIPIGSFVDDTVDRFGGELGSFQDTSTTELDEDDETFLVARDTDDGWRVSIGYTIAEQARELSGQPLPTDGIEPVGADSPEAAVEGMLEAIAGLDPAAVLARVSPGELGALQEYAPIFLGDLEPGAIDDASVEINDVDLRSETDGDRATVFVEGFDVSVIGEDGSEIGAVLEDGCITVSGDVDDLTELTEGSGIDLDEPICSDDLDAFSGSSALEEFGLELPDGLDLETPELGITTTEVDGSWYVAPIATGLDSLIAGLEVLDRDTLDSIVDAIEELFTAFSEEFDGALGDDFGDDFDDPIGSDPDDFEVEPAPDTVPEVPTTDASGTDPDGNVDGLRELSQVIASSPEEGDCIYDTLSAGDPAIADELAASWIEDLTPSQEAQDAFFEAVESCA